MLLFLSYLMLTLSIDNSTFCPWSAVFSLISGTSCCSWVVKIASLISFFVDRSLTIKCANIPGRRLFIFCDNPQELHFILICLELTSLITFFCTKNTYQKLRFLTNPLFHLWRFLMILLSVRRERFGCFQFVCFSFVFYCVLIQISKEIPANTYRIPTHSGACHYIRNRHFLVMGLVDSYIVACSKYPGTRACSTIRSLSKFEQTDRRFC